MIPGDRQSYYEDYHILQVDSAVSHDLHIKVA
jgi:hypothetical protein